MPDGPYSEQDHLKSPKALRENGNRKLSVLSAADIFEGEALVEYHRRLDALVLRLENANDSAFVLRRVLDFPAFFVHPAFVVFLNVLAKGCSDAAIVTIVAITSDRRRDVWTLAKLRRWMLENSRLECRTALETILVPPPLSQSALAIFGRARNIRHRLIAHYNEGLVVRQTRPRQGPYRAPKEPDVSMTVGELHEILEMTTALATQLALGSPIRVRAPEHNPNPAPATTYEPPGIDRVLLHIAQESDAFRRPEMNPEAWPDFLESLTDEQIEQFNYWRQLAGWPLVARGN